MYLNNCKIVLQKKSSVLIFDKSHQELCCINNPGNHFLGGSNNSFPYKGFYRIYLFRALYSSCNFSALFDANSIHAILS